MSTDAPNEALIYTRRGAVAVLTLNNPPVNGLGYALRCGIVAGLERALADTAAGGHPGAGILTQAGGGGDGRPRSGRWAGAGTGLPLAGAAARRARWACRR
jgi:3-hydroxyacyl-CoA dehydrogenase